MSMDFWAAQRHRKLVTVIYLILFIALTVALALGSEVTFRDFAGPDYNSDLPYIAILFAGITFIVAGFNWLMFRSQGGSYVAESVGGKQVLPYTQDMHERQLINIVNEIAIAAHVQVPKIYILNADEINAFAAGMTQGDAAIAVTRGAMRKLTRDQLQGVIAHEFGHIANADMRLGLNIAAMVAGFYFLFILGMRFFQIVGYQRDENGRQGNPLILAAFILVIAGLVAWFVGTLFRLAISRQRELLADASSVQYTRNPEGLIGALKAIEKDMTPPDMPIQGSKFAHMYFNHEGFLSGLFATHPPISTRIALLEGKE